MAQMICETCNKNPDVGLTAHKDSLAERNGLAGGGLIPKFFHQISTI